MSNARDNIIVNKYTDLQLARKENVGLCGTFVLFGSWWLYTNLINNNLSSLPPNLTTLNMLPAIYYVVYGSRRRYRRLSDTSSSMLPAL